MVSAERPPHLDLPRVLEALGLADQTPQVDEAMQRGRGRQLDMVNQRLIPVAIGSARCWLSMSRVTDAPRSILHQVPHAHGAIATQLEMSIRDVWVVAPRWAADLVS